jgi:hypothetical protein
MITVSDTARALIDSGRYVYHVRASSWLNGVLLADNVPIASGGEDGDRSLNVMERVTLTVPRRAHGVDWTPVDEYSPLAARDQTLKIQLGIGQGVNEPEWFQRGEFLITETIPDGDTLSVTCASLLTLTDEAKFSTPFQPASTATLGSTLRKLVEPDVLVDLSAAPQDRPISLTWINWDTDRLAAMWALLDAWPADAIMTEQGVLKVFGTTPPSTPVRTFTDEAGGTVVTAAPTSRRSDPTTLLIVTGYASNGSEIRRAQLVRPPTPPSRPQTAREILLEEIRRRTGVKAKPVKVDTSLITEAAVAAAVARYMASRVARRWHVKRLLIECPPDPTLQLADCVGVWADGVWTVGTVEAIDLPYTPGAMRLEVASLTP